MTAEISGPIYQRMLAAWRKEVVSRAGREWARRAMEDSGTVPEYRAAARAALEEWRARSQ